jgi:hypothetical protein
MEKIVVILVLALTACSSASRTPTPASMSNAQPASVGGGQAFVDGSVSPDGGSAQPDGRIPEGFVDGSSMLDGMAAVPGSDASQGQDAGSNPAGQDSGSTSDSGSGGSDAGQDAGSDAMVPTCPGSGPGTKCEGLQRFACVSGQWAEQETCSHVCQAGACVGVCNPGAKDCSGSNPRTCNSNGQWVSGVACSFVCSIGDCVGACVPGDRDCSGLIPRHCDNSGAWVSESACQYVCSGLGACSGSCAPSAVDCQSNVPRSCDSNGNWQSGSACQFTCSGGSCGGMCVPNAKRCNGLGSETCDSNGQWQPSSTCPYVCSGAGVCSGSCVPSSHQCSGNGSQTCDSNGNWQSPQSCQYVCDSSSGICGGVCVPGAQKCSGAQIQICASNGQWGSASNCAAVTGATVACDAGSNSCKATCTGSHFDCNGNMADGCEADVSADANNCGVCGHSCCGGACGGGSCGVYVPNISTPTSGASTPNYEVDQNNLYWVSYSATPNSAISQQPRLGGTTTTVTDTSTSGTATSINSIKSDGTKLYWSQSKGGIFSVAIAGMGTSSLTYSSMTGNFTVLSNHGAITIFDLGEYGTLALDATHLLWNASSDTNIRWKDRTISNPQVVSAQNIAVPGSPTSFVSDDTNLYVGSGNHKGLYRSDIASGTGADWITSTATNYSFGRISTDKSNVYYPFFNYTTISEIGLWKKSVVGSAPVQLVVDPYIGSYTATDGSYVYYLTNPNGSSSTTQVRKLAVNGGASQLVTTVNTSSVTVNNMKVVNSCLYWQESGTVKAIAVNP